MRRANNYFCCRCSAAAAAVCSAAAGPCTGITASAATAAAGLCGRLTCGMLCKGLRGTILSFAWLATAQARWLEDVEETWSRPCPACHHIAKPSLNSGCHWDTKGKHAIRTGPCLSHAGCPRALCMADCMRTHVCVCSRVHEGTIVCRSVYVCVCARQVVLCVNGTLCGSVRQPVLHRVRVAEGGGER